MRATPFWAVLDGRSGAISLGCGEGAASTGRAFRVIASGSARTAARRLALLGELLIEFPPVGVPGRAGEVDRPLITRVGGSVNQRQMIVKASYHLISGSFSYILI
ncbi:hypothetical protein MPTA5024_06320 [Microbispora sp. ATCC PTA-5024]|nr:hypothetical protein MPTA5024_06320 [Microbispora sp. ATCC PTA-5024]